MSLVSVTQSQEVICPQATQEPVPLEAIGQVLQPHAPQVSAYYVNALLLRSYYGDFVLWDKYDFAV